MPLVIQLPSHEIGVSLDQIPTITTNLNDDNSPDRCALVVDGIESLILFRGPSTERRWLVL
jgi:hypothetical protein